MLFQEICCEHGRHLEKRSEEKGKSKDSFFEQGNVDHIWKLNQRIERARTTRRTCKCRSKQSRQ